MNQYIVIKEKQKSIFTSLGLFFIKRYKVTILLVITFLAFGFLSYFNFLQKEGFPPIQVPVIFIRTQYLSGDVQITDKEVTLKIKEQLSNFKEIKKIESISSPFFSNITITLVDDVKDLDFLKNEIENKIKTSNVLPSNAQFSVILPDASTFDGTNNIIFTLANIDGSLNRKDLQNLAIELKDFMLSKSNLLDSVEVFNLINEVFNPTLNKFVEVETFVNRLGYKDEVSGSLLFVDGINIGVRKNSNDIGTLEFSNHLRGLVDEFLRKDEYKDKNLRAFFGSDQANFLNRQIQTLESSAVSAVLIIFIVLVIFVGLKSGLILGLFIPIVFGSVFFVFYLLGLSLNTISLFALVLALGLFVDDGTIVVEAIDLYRKRGNGPLKSVILAINDIALADISGTVTTLLVFFPLLFISGLLGEFIRILPITVIISLTLSLFIGLFVLPLFTILLSSRNQDSNNKLFKLFKNLDKLNILEKISNFVLKVGEILGNFTKTYLSNKYLLLVMVIFTFFVIGLGFSFVSRLGFSFFPPAKDSDSLSLNLTFAENLNLDRKRELFVEFEQKLKETIENYGELFSIQRNIGNTYQAQLFLTPLQQRDITSVQIAEKINQISDKFKDELSIRSSSISAGPPSQQLPFATQIYLKNFEDDKNAIDVINEFISSQSFENGNSVKETQIQYLNDIARLNGKRFIQIRAGFENNSDSSVLRLLKERITKEFDIAKLTELGVNSIEFDFGQESSNEESFNSLIVLSLLSLVLMYGVLVFQFNSFTQPLLILLAIPFALPGVLFGLYITDNPISFLMIIGLTGLIGIVVNNTIMLVDFANQNISKGYGIKESISKAISVRFRPILLTSLTTILGLVPLSLSEPFWEPLAVTIIFGLTSSVILVLFTFPIFYAIVQKLRHKFNFFKLDNILADNDI